MICLLIKAQKSKQQGKQFDLEAFLAEDEDDEGNALDDPRLDLEAELLKWSEGRIGMAKAMSVDVDSGQEGEEIEEKEEEEEIDLDTVLGLKSEAELERGEEQRQQGKEVKE